MNRSQLNETPVLDNGADQYLGRICAETTFVRDTRDRVAMCNCAWANKAAGRSNHWKNFSVVKANKDGTCPHCGFYTVLRAVDELAKIARGE